MCVCFLKAVNFQRLTKLEAQREKQLVPDHGLNSNAQLLALLEINVFSLTRYACDARGGPTVYMRCSPRLLLGA